MAATTETKIWMALRRHLEAFTPRPAYAFPGVIFTPHGSYVRVDFAPIQPEQVTLSEKPHLRNGILSLVVVNPLSHSGEQSLNLAGLLARHFPALSSYQFEDICVRIRAEPHVMGGFEDRGNWQVPVNISWQCFA